MAFRCVVCLTRPFRPKASHDDWVLTTIDYFGINNGRPIFGYLTSRKSRVSPIHRHRIRSLSDWLEQFGVNILIICFSGISKTWRENSQNSLNTITRIGHINHLTVKRLTLSAVMFNHDAHCSINILGIHTAMGFTIRRLLRELWIRHAQALKR